MGTEIVEKEEKFVLPERKVTVRYIMRKRGMAANVNDDHVIAGGMLNTAEREYCVPLNRNGYMVNILTKAEKDFLESHEGINRDLSVYSSKDFWEKRRVKLIKGDNILDLSNPIDYINYKILLSNKDFIAPSLAEKNNKLTYQYVIIDEGEERELQKQSFNYKKKAFKLYSNIENSEEILRGILRIVNKRPVSKESSLEWLQGEVEKIIDTNAKVFVELIEDPIYEYKILLAQATEKGLVITQNQRYATAEGIELSEPGQIASFDNAVKYLADPKNQELADILKAKLNV